MNSASAGQAVIGTLGVTLLSLVGVVTLWLDDVRLERVIPPVLALSIGALLGDAFVHLIPEAYKNSGSWAQVVFLVCAGAFAFFLLEFSLSDLKGRLRSAKVLPVGPLSLVANAVHNFVDGVVIGVSFLAGSAVGGPTLLAVALHEIPHEASNYGILLHAGYNRRVAILLNFSAGLFAMLGVGVALLIGKEATARVSVALPLTAGCFIYMCLGDLVPAVHSRTKGRNLLWPTALFFSGIAIMFGTLFLE